MVETSQEQKRDRTRSAIAAAAIHLALGYALTTGLGFELPPVLGDELKLFDVPPQPPPPPEAPPPPAASADLPAGAPAPPNLKAEPTPIVAPPPAIRLDPPSPIVAAPVPGLGSAASAGAAEVKGPGTGAGGAGSGRGGGGEGSGAGRPSGAEPVPARKLSGALIPFQLPRSVMRADLGADITFRIAVGADGRVAACTVEQMIGAAEIVPYACRAIQERYRYEPARDAEGKNVASVMFENHAWGVERRRSAPRREP